MVNAKTVTGAKKEKEAQIAKKAVQGMIKIEVTEEEEESAKENATDQVTGQVNSKENVKETELEVRGIEHDTMLLTSV
jgi:hypothetical protein